MTNPTTRYGHIEPEHQGKVLNVKQAGPGEVEHHGGSFRKYMDNKNQKLQEQFDQQSAVAAAYGAASGHAISELFKGVSIMVNGFTTPSQQDLKQIMAQHGGNFEIYYHRGRITHIICSNLTDAKVKIFQRERNPTPVVRPEWIVDSLKAGAILPLEEYVLWRLRDVPGQRTLSAFRQQPGTGPQGHEKPSHIGAALPPSPYGKYTAAAVGDDSRNQVSEPVSSVAHDQHQAATAALNRRHASGLPSRQTSDAALDRPPEEAAVGGDTNHFQLGTGQTGPAKALNFESAGTVQPRATSWPEAQMDPLSGVHAMDSHIAAPMPSTLLTSGLQDTPSMHIHDYSDGDDEPAYTAELKDSCNYMRGHDSAAVQSEADAIPTVNTERMNPAAVTTNAPANTVAAAEEYRIAHERAASARAACDMLRGPPKSSRDDPHFMDSYYKSSRLSFIGRWKARIEALTATMAAHAPLPQTAQQPSALVNAFRGNQAVEVSTERSIIHLDMDCFFASVAALGEPAFAGKPLAVSHSNSAQGTGEISSANYEARKFGIRASMFIAEAKKRCPHLIVMPYQFDKYEEVSEQVYKILLKATACVQPVSCDEAYLDVTGLGDSEEVASSIRQQIFEATGCTASAGIGPSMLVARLATKKGKPNGQYRIHSRQVDAYLLDLAVDELPGVGWNICQKLKELGIKSVRDVRASTKDALQREIGNKTGTQVWSYAHGTDDRQVEPPKSRKSVGAECNWGIRFQNDADALAFMDDLAGELSTRMKAAGVRGRTISLKLKRRKTGAPDPPKFMGHGDCDNMSRSVTLSRFTDAASELGSQGKALLRALRIDPTQIRGIGLNVTKLDTDPASAAAKPGSAAPSKVSAPPPSVHDPRTGPWVRFWQDKPQPWGVPPAVKSATELAAANVSQSHPQPSEKADAATGSRQAPSAAFESLSAQAADVSRSTTLASNNSARVPGALPVPLGAGAVTKQGLDWGQAGRALTEPASNTNLAGASERTAAMSMASRLVAGQAAATTASTPVTSQAAASAPVVAAAGKAPAKQAAFNMYSPSKGTLQILQKPPSKGPSPKKQLPLDQMLSNQAAAAQAHAVEAKQQQQCEQAQLAAPDSVRDATLGLGSPISEAEAASQPRSRVVLPHAGLASAQSPPPPSRLQGLTLSQIDASVFAALPAEHQQELLSNLPKNTAGTAGKATGEGATAARQAAAGDFAFVTKLANLQKAGHAPMHDRASSSGADMQARADQAAAVSGPADAVGKAASKPATSGNAGQTEAAEDSVRMGDDARLQVAKEPVSELLGVQPMSDIGASDQTASSSHMASDSPRDAPSSEGVKSVNDRASLPPFEGSLQGRQATKAPQAVRTEMHKQLPQTTDTHPNTAQHTQHANQGQEVRQAQQHEEVDADLAAAEDTGQQHADLSGDEAVGLELDLDLMEEERTALAVLGHAVSSHCLQPPGAASEAAPNDVNQARQAINQRADAVPPVHKLSVASHGTSVQQQQQAQGLKKTATLAAQQAVAALPPASQVDASVLDALPLQVRRELELAYGLAPRRSPSKGAKRGRQAGRGAPPAKAVPSKRQRVLDPPQALARQAGRLAAHSRMTDAALSFTQVDPSVLSELPQELQDELAALLPSTSRPALHSRAQPARLPSDMPHPAAARMNLLMRGRHLGNSAIQLEQERAEAAAEQAREAAVTPVVNEPASELWDELQIALQALSAVEDATEGVESDPHDDGSEGAEHEAAVLKMQALVGIVLQWVSRQVQRNLEDVYYLLRRLAEFSSDGFVQQSISRLIKDVQAQVQAAHGAKLRLQPLFM